MRLSWRIAVCATAALFLMISLVDAAVPAPQALPGPIVDAGWLSQNLDNVAVLDVRMDSRTFVEEGHIPTARLIDWRLVRSSRMEDGFMLDDMLPERAAFTSLMRQAGVRKDAAIVITSRGLKPTEVFLATRLYWQLKYYGHDKVAILDGGTGAWAVSGLALASGGTEPVAYGDWVASEERRSLVVDTREMMEIVARGTHDVADTRSLLEFLGLSRHWSVSENGHIPGAKLADATLFVHATKPVRFRSTAEMKTLVGRLGFGEGRPAVIYCNTGDWASGVWFVLHEVMGRKNTALYDGSMHAWTRVPGRTLTQFSSESRRPH